MSRTWYTLGELQGLEVELVVVAAFAVAAEVVLPPLQVVVAAAEGSRIAVAVVVGIVAVVVALVVDTAVGSMVHQEAHSLVVVVVEGS